MTTSPSKIQLCCSLWMLVFIYSGCTTSSSSSNSVALQEKEQKKAAEVSTGTLKPNDPLTTGFFNSMPDALKDGWHQFTRDGRYRAARLEDFRFPDEAKKVIEQLRARTEFPYLRLGFDINHDGDFNDFAAIVVDNTQNDEARFGLVIFNPAKNEQKIYVPHWVYRNRDLSKTVMTTASARLVVEQYLDDGSEKICFVKWEPQRKIYTCN